MYYETIRDMNLYCWRKAMKGDFTFFRTNRDEGDSDADSKAFSFLYNEFLQTFGFGRDLQEIVDLKISLAQAQIEYIQTGNFFLQNKIRMFESQLKERLNTKEDENSQTIDDCLFHLSKYMGFKVSEKEIGVVEFYTYLENFKRESKQLTNKDNG